MEQDTVDRAITAPAKIKNTPVFISHSRPGAWRAEQVADHLLAAVDRGDFYVICPDGETTPEMDRKRILWAAMDMTENRPALSRWHPDHAEAFEAFEPA